MNGEVKSNTLLRVEDLKTHFHYKDQGTVKAVDGISFAIEHGSTMGLVGESGCGKSVAALSILRLLPEPPAKVTGHVSLSSGSGVSVLSELQPNGREIRKIRGHDIAMVFQEPMTSLNPVYSIGAQIAETISLHQSIGTKEARKRAIEALATVGIDRPHERADNYPHQFSGGMRQRALIAMAISCNPKILIADEPTTALDVTIQAQILELLEKIQEERGMSIIFITHDLGVISNMCEHVSVMYLGKIVESGTTLEIFENPLHPYTTGLLRSMPVWHKRQLTRERMVPIPGVVPEPYDVPPGCAFEPRCNLAIPACKELPALIEKTPGHQVRCWLSE